MIIYIAYGLLLLHQTLVQQVCGQCSLQEASGGNPPFTDDNSNNVIGSGSIGTQAIVPTYTFNCCANITRWQTYVQPGGGGHRNGVYSICFQVWRPSASVNGCVTKVEENRFNDVVLDSDGQINEEVLPINYISVQPGDIVGFYIISDNGRDNEGVQLDESPEYSDNQVWYEREENLVPPLLDLPCNYILGDMSMGQLTMSVQAAPLLMVTLSEFECPSTATSIPSDTIPPDVNPDNVSPTEQPPEDSNSSSSLADESTGAVNATPGITGVITVGVIVGVVVLVVTVAVCLLALIIAYVVWKKMQSRKRKGNDKEQTNNLELSNPNYTYDGVVRKPEKSSIKADSYTVLGPEVADSLTPNQQHQSASTPTPHEESTCAEELGDVYDEPRFDSAVYDDPTQTNFRKTDNRLNIAMFEVEGYYVPTMEERTKQGLNKHQSSSASSYNKLNFFVEDQVYWAPASTASDLYSQLSSKKYREIPRYQIKLQAILGSGQFGEVHKALWNVDHHKLKLAVKTLKSGTSEEDKVKFLQEAAIMGQFSHINVIKMYGVVTVGEPILICTEILENGDLLNYLNKSIAKEVKKNELQHTFLKFAQDIATGMDYLSRKCFVHRDLAARNILLCKHLICKVADFGMARDLMDDTYYTSSGGKIPIKWTAPEAILYKKYSTDSDVWSYGMVLFEIWSVGKKPYNTLTNPQVLRLLSTGYCQPPPPGCPRAIYQLMVDCWNPSHQSRSTFSTISESYLRQPPSKLLYWSHHNNSISRDVGVCGAPLSAAEKLYSDLQHKYEVPSN